MNVAFTGRLACKQSDSVTKHKNKAEKRADLMTWFQLFFFFFFICSSLIQENIC